jgi:trk system potassium uptake protein TrkA
MMARSDSKRFLVVGLGHFGAWAAFALHAQGHEVIAVDRNGDLVDRAVDRVDVAVMGDATDVAFLRRIGAEDADAAVVSTGEDLAASVLTVLALKDLGVRDVYVKVPTTEAARAVEAFNVTETVFPEREAAYRLAHRISSKTVLDYIPVAPGFSIQEIAVPDAWIGRTLAQLALPQRYGIQVVAIQDVLTDSLNVVPQPGRALKESDIMVVVGRDETLADLLHRARDEAPAVPADDDWEGD